MQIPQNPPPTALDSKAATLSEARQTANKYRDDHTGIFDVMTKLDADVAKAEAELKATIRPTGMKSYDGFGLAVTVTYPQKVDYDAAKLLERRPDLWAAHPEAFEINTDKAAVRRLVDLNKISEEDLEYATTTTARTPAVSIKQA